MNLKTKTNKDGVELVWLEDFNEWVTMEQALRWIINKENLEGE